MNPFTNKEDYWISLSDIMTGLMVIFMFIAISYIVQIQEKQRETDELIKDYQTTVIDLYETLQKEFEEDCKKPLLLQACGAGEGDVNWRSARP